MLGGAERRARRAGAVAAVDQMHELATGVQAEGGGQRRARAAGEPALAIGRGSLGQALGQQVIDDDEHGVDRPLHLVPIRSGADGGRIGRRQQERAADHR